MSHFIALSINNKQNVACALSTIGNIVFPPSKGGWGLGYYQSGELLSTIEPCEEEVVDFNASEILASIDAQIVLLHARDASVGEVRRENTHPFRFQHWTMAHNGTFVGFESYKGEILESMPPYIRRSIKGDTDSEHFFHLFLSFLYDDGKVNRADIGTESIRSALWQSVAMMDNFSNVAGHAPSKLSVVISDGYTIVAFARGIPINYALIEGVRDCEICRSSRPPKTEGSGINHDELRAVIIRSCLSPIKNDVFQVLNDNTILSVTSNLKLEFTSMGTQT